MIDFDEAENLDKAIKDCEDLVNCSVLVKYVFDGHEQVQIPCDKSSIQCLLDTIKRNIYLISKLNKSDASKEISSMNYYNNYRDVLNEVYDRDNIIREMAKYISQFRDCPLENEDTDLDCETKCTNTDIDCWIQYFYKKAGVDYE